MKKLITLFISLFMVFALVGCSSKTEEEPVVEEVEETEVTRIALLLPYVGDQSYFDITNHGLTLLEEQYGDAVECTLIEMGTDSANWEAVNRQAAEAGYDIIISGNWQYEEAMCTVAAEYPDIKYVNFDYSSAELNSLDNIISVSYACNETGWLAGIVAGVKTQTNIVCGICASDTPSMNQFMGGFLQGVHDANPDCKIILSYIGGNSPYADPARAKELANDAIAKGADVLWGCAGGSGDGVFEAASEHEGVWAIGVDSDQWQTFSEKPEIQNVILTSAMKNCDKAILKLVSEIIEGTAAMGTQRTLGYADGLTDLAENDFYLANMTEDELAAVNALKEQLAAGTITVVDEAVESGITAQLAAEYALD